jgi:hypothetical protein
MLSTVIAKKIRESRMLALLLMFIGLFCGFLFSILAIKDISIHQQYALYRAQTLAQGENQVLSVENYLIDPLNEGKLIHLTGQITLQHILKDTLFDLTAINAIALRRIVTMYQWTENTHKNQDDTLSYRYEKIWTEDLIDSNRFSLSETHQNPQTMLITEKTLFAKHAQLGEFILPSNLLKKMTHSQWEPLSAMSFWHLPEKLASQLGEKKIQLYDGHYYIGQTPNSPQIGDLQIRFEMIQAKTISLVARQFQSTLMAYQTQTAGEIELFELGTFSAEEMFNNAKKQNILNIFSESFGRFLIMVLGFYLIFIALWLSKNALPILGHPAHFRGGLISVVFAAIVTLIMSGLAWLDYSPIIGRTLIVIAISLLYFLRFARRPPQPTLIQENIVPQKQNHF